MEKALEILKASYEKQNEATEKLREIYDCGKDLTTDQRNWLLGALNAQSEAALSIHQTINLMNK